MPRLARISNLKGLLIGGITLITNSPKAYLNCLTKSVFSPVIISGGDFGFVLILGDYIV
jgi:hypothetical protein